MNKKIIQVNHWEIHRGDNLGFWMRRPYFNFKGLKKNKKKQNNSNRWVLLVKTI